MRHGTLPCLPLGLSVWLRFVIQFARVCMHAGNIQNAKSSPNTESDSENQNAHPNSIAKACETTRKQSNSPRAGDK